MQTAKHILAHLHSLENKANQAGMKRFAIGNDNTLGISLPVLREISKSLKKQNDRHALAKTLWKSNIHEAMILASMLADPKQFSAEEMDSWTLQFYSWDLCDQVCTNLFHKTPYYLEKAFAYSYHSEEFVKRCGFVLMVQYTVHHKKESDEMCLQFLKRIEEEAGDERNFVKKALNWCLRQIGKRNAFLHPHALAAAHRIFTQGSRSARWIANDAIRELESEAIIQRLGLKP
jgi:3-methyladenine DNA glycosylase AlkD